MSSALIALLFDGLLETLVMVGVSGGIGAAFGIPLGVVLILTDRGGILRRESRICAGSLSHPCRTLTLYRDHQRLRLHVRLQALLRRHLMLCPAVPNGTRTRPPKGRGWDPGAGELADARGCASAAGPGRA